MINAHLTSGVEKLIYILNVLVGHVCLYGGFSAVELGLSFLGVACVHRWISTEKSFFLLCSLKVVVICTILDIKQKEGKK